jgi:DNA-binding response OmpR family regulator
MVMQGYEPAPATAESRRVLIVEDDESLAKLITRNLAIRGHDVRTVGSETSAVAALAAQTPDVMILDINLPDGTGWDVLRTVQLDPATRVVMLTAVPVSPKRLAEFRPVAYLPKPFPLEALVRLVEQASGPTEEDGEDANQT